MRVSGQSISTRYCASAHRSLFIGYNALRFSSQWQFHPPCVCVCVCVWTSIQCMTVTSLFSGVAGPLAAQGGGQICRPFLLGFWNWRAVSNVIADDRYTLAVTLCFSCTQTHMKLTVWIFTCVFFNFRPFAAPTPLASAARCGPHPRRYATVTFLT